MTFFSPRRPLLWTTSLNLSVMEEEVKVLKAEARPAIEARPTAADNAAKDFIQTVARAATHSQIDYMKKVVHNLLNHEHY